MALSADTHTTLCRRKMVSYAPHRAYGRRDLDGIVGHWASYGQPLCFGCSLAKNRLYQEAGDREVFLRPVYPLNGRRAHLMLPQENGSDG